MVYCGSIEELGPWGGKFSWSGDLSLVSIANKGEIIGIWRSSTAVRILGSGVLGSNVALGKIEL